MAHTGKCAGPGPEAIFFSIVQRGVMLEAVGLDPVPNHKRDIGKDKARFDGLAAEFPSRKIELTEPLKDTSDGLRGFERKDADGYVLFFGRPHS